MVGGGSGAFIGAIHRLAANLDGEIELVCGAFSQDAERSRESGLALAFGAGGASGTGGMALWPLFGSTNQILAGMTLLIISVMLIRLGRPSIYTVAPMLFVLAMSFTIAYELTGCLLVTFAMHSLFNTTQVMLMFSPVQNG